MSSIFQHTLQKSILTLIRFEKESVFIRLCIKKHKQHIRICFRTTKMKQKSLDKKVESNSVSNYSQISSNAELKKKLTYCCLCSLNFECGVFIICGFVIAVTGNIATAVIYNSSILHVAYSLSKDTNIIENRTAIHTTNDSLPKDSNHASLDTLTDEFSTENLDTGNKDEHIIFLNTTQRQVIFHFFLKKTLY